MKKTLTFLGLILAVTLQAQVIQYKSLLLSVPLYVADNTTTNLKTTTNLLTSEVAMMEIGRSDGFWLTFSGCSTNAIIATNRTNTLTFELSNDGILWGGTNLPQLYVKFNMASNAYPVLPVFTNIAYSNYQGFRFIRPKAIITDEQAWGQTIISNIGIATYTKPF